MLDRANGKTSMAIFVISPYIYIASLGRIVIIERKIICLVGEISS